LKIFFELENKREEGYIYKPYKKDFGKPNFECCLNGQDQEGRPGHDLVWNITREQERDKRFREGEEEKPISKRKVTRTKLKCNLIVKPKVTCMHECNDDAQTIQTTKKTWKVTWVAHLGCYSTLADLGGERGLKPPHCLPPGCTLYAASWSLSSRPSHQEYFLHGAQVVGKDGF
jgi:hypothetical protein